MDLFRFFQVPPNSPRMFGRFQTERFSVMFNFLSVQSQQNNYLIFVYLGSIRCLKLNLEKGISSLISHFCVMSSDIDTLGLMFKYWKELLTNPCRIDFHWDLKIVIFNLVHVAHIHHWRDQIGGSCFGNSIHKGCVRASKRKSIKGVSKY